MTSSGEAVGHKRPPSSSRFVKGRSGNPKGRPRKEQARTASAFDVIFDRTLTVTQGGSSRELTIDEALQLKTYQEAITGNRSARREVLKMIAKREKVLASRAPPHKPIDVQIEREDPRNADEAMLILGIACPDPSWAGREGAQERLLLEPWAVQAALSRRGPKNLDTRDVSGIERCTRDPQSIRWPSRPIE